MKETSIFGYWAVFFTVYIVATVLLIPLSSIVLPNARSVAIGIAFGFGLLIARAVSLWIWTRKNL